MINRSKMQRQLYRGGGITHLRRQKYGLGDFVRKLIPNELADVAVKAAPFVAPFNAPVAGLMRGIGRYDQRGSLSDALKQGVATYGFGQLARGIGGAPLQTGNPFTEGGAFTKEGFKSGFSSPLSAERTQGIRNLFKGRGENQVTGTNLVDADDVVLASQKVTGTKGTDPFSLGNIWKKFQSMDPGMRTAIVGVGSGALAGVAQWFENQIPQEPGESMEEYMARRKVAVGKLMKQYLDNTRSFDPTWSALTDEQKVAEVAKLNLNQGGRVGYQSGGISMGNTLAENIARNRAAQQQFSESIAPAQQAARAAILAATPKSLTGPTTKLYSGTTSATPFGGSKFFATPDLATAKTYATSSPLRGSPLSGPVTGRILEAEVPTSQAQSLLKKGLTGTREVVLDPQAAKTLFETGKGTLKGAGSLATKAAVAGTKALPFVGGAVSLADAALRAKEGDYIGAGLGAAGAVPVLGLPALGAQVLYDQFIKKDSKESKPDSEAAAAEPVMVADSSLIGPENLKNFPGATNRIEVWDPITKGWTSVGMDSPENRANAASMRADIAAKLGGEQGRKYLEQYADEQNLASGGRVGLKHGTPEEGIKSLDAGAMDITYEGNEGPQAPMKMVGQGPILPSDEDPVNPFQPKPTGPVLPDKMMASDPSMGDELNQMSLIIFKKPLSKLTDDEYEDLQEYIREKSAQGGRIGFDNGGGTFDFDTEFDALTKRYVKIYQALGLSEAEAWTKVIEILKKDLGENRAEGGRIGYRMGMGPAGLPGIPRQAPDGMEFDMRENGGFQGLGAKEGKDDVPAMLAKNEFVMTADAVRGAGGGDIELGAQRMYDTMKNLEKRVV